jgi:hypothetical protein
LAEEKLQHGICKIFMHYRMTKNLFVHAKPEKEQKAGN